MYGAIGETGIVKFTVEGSNPSVISQFFPINFNSPKHLIADQEGDLWISHSKGLSQLILRGGEILDSTFHSFQKFTYSVSESKPRDQKLISFEPDLIFPLNEKQLLLSGKSYPNQDIYYPLGIYDIDKRTLIPIFHDMDAVITLPPDNYSHRVSAIWRDSPDHFWLTTTAHGLHRLKIPENWEDSTYLRLNSNPYFFYWDKDGAQRRDSTAAHQPQFAMIKDHSGNLWIGGQITLMKIDLEEKGMEKISFPPTFLEGSRKKRGAFVDKMNRLWNYETPNKLYYWDTLHKDWIPFLGKDNKPILFGPDFGNFLFRRLGGETFGGDQVVPEEALMEGISTSWISKT